MNVRKFSQLAIGLFLGLVLAGAVGSVWSLVSDKLSGSAGVSGSRSANANTYNCNVGDSCQFYGDQGQATFNCKTEGACVRDARWTGGDISRLAMAAATLVLVSYLFFIYMRRPLARRSQETA